MNQFIFKWTEPRFTSSEMNQSKIDWTGDCNELNSREMNWTEEQCGGELGKVNWTGFKLNGLDPIGTI